MSPGSLPTAKTARAARERLRRRFGKDQQTAWHRTFFVAAVAKQTCGSISLFRGGSRSALQFARFIWFRQELPFR